MNTRDHSVLFLKPGAGRRFSLPDRGAVATLKAVGGDTRGQLSVVETAPDPGAPGLAMHRHRRSDEALYILQGEVVVRAGERTETLGAGSFVLIPRGVAHMFWNPGPDPARALVIFAPAGVERFLEETAAAFTGGVPDPSRLREIRIKYDTEMVDE